jgi:hypothetical protein
MSAISVFRLLPNGFSNRDLRAHTAPLQGLDPQSLTPGRMTYDLRRLRLHALVERIPHSHRYRVTDNGWRTAMLVTRAYNHILRPGLAELSSPLDTGKLGQAVRLLDAALAAA